MSHWDKSTLGKLCLPEADSRTIAQIVADVTPELDRNHSAFPLSLLRPAATAVSHGRGKTRKQGAQPACPALPSVDARTPHA